MSLVPNSFKFSRGQLLKQLTVDRMNAILSMARRGQPAMGGHKGLLIKHTPNGWTASVLRDKKSVKTNFPVSAATDSENNPKAYVGHGYFVANENGGIYSLFEDSPKNPTVWATNKYTSLFIEDEDGDVYGGSITRVNEGYDLVEGKNYVYLKVYHNAGDSLAGGGASLPFTSPFLYEAEFVASDSILGVVVGEEATGFVHHYLLATVDVTITEGVHSFKVEQYISQPLTIPGYVYDFGSGGGGELPVGEKGDILYHNGEAWVVLSPGDYDAGKSLTLVPYAAEGEEPAYMLPEWQPSIQKFRIDTANHGVFEVPFADAMDGYNPATHSNWSLQFSVTGGALDDKSASPANPVGTDDMDDGENPPGENTELYDGDAEPETPVAQTYTRIAIVRGGEWVCTGGVFRENTFCAGSRGPIVELARR